MVGRRVGSLSYERGTPVTETRVKNFVKRTFSANPLGMFPEFIETSTVADEASRQSATKLIRA